MEKLFIFWISFLLIFYLLSSLSGGRGNCSLEFSEMKDDGLHTQWKCERGRELKQTYFKEELGVMCEKLYSPTK